MKKKSRNHVIGSSITANECGSCPDAYEIEVHCTEDSTSAATYSIDGFIDDGNFQIHPAVGEMAQVISTKGKPN